MENYAITNNGKILSAADAPQNRNNRVLGLKLKLDGVLIPWKKIKHEVDFRGIKRGYAVTYENETKRQWRVKKPLLHVSFPIAGVTQVKGRWLLNQKRIPAELINLILNIAEQQEAFFKWLRCFDWIDGPFAEINFAGKNVALVFFPTMARLYLVSRKNNGWRTRQIGKTVKQVCSTTTEKNVLCIITAEPPSNLGSTFFGTEIRGYRIDLEQGKIATLPKQIVQLLVDKATISQAQN
jgi:hypothetical protein